MLALGEQMRGLPSMGAEPPKIDLSHDVFMGHEFAAEVLEVGKDTESLAPGTLVTSIPVLLSMTGIDPIVYSNTTLGGYAERMLLSAPLLLEVPNGLDPRHAALTEPMAVGLHAVNRSNIVPGEGALVLGCGPVGIAVIAALKLKGIECIVAADFSPARRALASQMGATEVVDPAVEPSFDAWYRVGTGGLVVFEAIGVPGIIDGALRDAPAGARIVVVGRLHGARLDHAVLRRSARSWTCSSASATTRPSSPARCGRSPRATSTSRRSSPARSTWTGWRARSTSSATPSATARSWCVPEPAMGAGHHAEAADRASLSRTSPLWGT